MAPALVLAPKGRQVRQANNETCRSYRGACCISPAQASSSLGTAIYRQTSRTGRYFSRCRRGLRISRGHYWGRLREIAQQNRRQTVVLTATSGPIAMGRVKALVVRTHRGGFNSPGNS